MNYEIITQLNDLQRVCLAARQADMVMLDTEFVRIRTFYPQLGLIQLYDGETLSLIDPRACEDMRPFIELLQDEKVLKVLHACGEDIEVFKHVFGSVPSPMIDTQIMAAFLGHGISTGFAALAKECVGVELDKSESRTDWLARPLSQKQLDYAAADVFYLQPIYQQLLQQVTEKGWWTAAQQESNLYASKRIKTHVPEQAYLSIKEAWLLSPKELAILKPLAQWRYEEAMRKDLALNFVLKETELLTIVRLEITQFKRLVEEGIDYRTAQRHGNKIIDLVKSALKTPAKDYPAKIESVVEYPGYKQRFNELKKEVKAISNHSGLAPEFLASKKQLNQFFTWVWLKERDPENLPDVMQGWRLPLLGEKLNQLL